MTMTMEAPTVALESVAGIGGSSAQMVVAACQMLGASAKDLKGTEAIRYLSMFDRFVSTVVVGLGGVVALDLTGDSTGVSVRLLVGSIKRESDELSWHPDIQLKRFSLQVARGFAFKMIDASAYLDQLRDLHDVMVFDPATIEVAQGGLSASAVLPLQVSGRGMGTIAQVLEEDFYRSPCTIRAIVAPMRGPRPDPAVVVSQLADADRLHRDSEASPAVAYRAAGVRLALQRMLDCWLGQPCTTEVQIRAKSIGAVHRIASLLENELTRPKIAELDEAWGRRPRMRLETDGGELPELAVPPTRRSLPSGNLSVAPVPSFWQDGTAEKPRNLATVESAVSLIVPPLPQYCDLSGISATIVEDRITRQPERWSGTTSIGTDSAGSEISLDGEAIAKHVHVLGVPGSGKTTILRRMVSSDLHTKRGFIVLDPHSDLAQRIGSDVPWPTIPGPLPNGVLSNMPFKRLRLLSSSAQGHDAVLRDIGVIIETIQSALPRRYTGPVFRRLLSSVLTLHAYVGASELIGAADEYLEDDERLLQALESYDGPAKVRSYLQNTYLRMKPHDRAELAEWVTSKFSDYLRTSAALQLFAPVGEGVTALEIVQHDAQIVVDFGLLGVSPLDAGYLGQMFIGAFLRSLMTGGPDVTRRFVLYLDEVQLFFGPSVERALQEGRKFGLCVVAAHQTSSQLTPARFDALMGQVGLELLFRCSLRDSTLLAERLDLDIDALAALPDFHCWVAGTTAVQRGGSFRLTTSL